MSILFTSFIVRGNTQESVIEHLYYVLPPYITNRTDYIMSFSIDADSMNSLFRQAGRDIGSPKNRMMKLTINVTVGGEVKLPYKTNIMFGLCKTDVPVKSLVAVEDASDFDVSERFYRLSVFNYPCNNL